jgi:hypothetical protein
MNIVVDRSVDPVPKAYAVKIDEESTNVTKHFDGRNERDLPLLR